MTDERQRIVRVAGARRAKLTPVEGTTSEPHAREDPSAPPPAERGPNDERMLREVPPHY
ncbi:hypothetical protein [Microbacterium esteraromaticum]|uniref:hypothetical protein n=1 Tax=Microbacterium esteraromaticum TaxID=57043 RepID=UPI0015F4E07C|nr:hypothetical protein [Microbacterium esteraromaticum]